MWAGSRNRTDMMDLLQEQMGQLKKKISSPQNYRNCKLGSLEAALRQRFR